VARSSCQGHSTCAPQPTMLRMSPGDVIFGMATVLACTSLCSTSSQQTQLPVAYNFVGSGMMFRPAHGPPAPIDLAASVPATRRPIDQKPSTGSGHFAAGALLFLAAAARHRVVCRAAKKGNYQMNDPQGIDGNDGTEKNRQKLKSKYFQAHPYVDKKIQAKWPNMGYRISGGPGFPGSPHPWIEKIRWCHHFKTRIHIRKKVEGTCARPRMAVFMSKKKTYVNIMDDTIGLGQTLLCLSTQQADVKHAIREETGCKEGKEDGNRLEAAEILGKIVAKKCLEKEITQIVFDRGGFYYHNRRMKALAEAARSGGLQF